MKVFKKGAKVKLSCCSSYSTEECEVIELERDYSENEMNEIAWQHALEVIQPEGWFEVEDE